MPSEIYMIVLAYKMNSDFWHQYPTVEKDVFQELNETISRYESTLIHLKSYRSLRYDNDLIFWASSFDPELLSNFKIEANRSMKGFGESQYSMISLYEHSPYLLPGKTLADTLKTKPLRYFVAYPMSKSPDWYLIDFDERKKIMAEHIGMAAGHPEGRGIKSYTTYSYGLGDQEFVVLYEMDSLASWSHVTAKLREATARKWIINEVPILVGLLSDPISLEVK